LCERHIRRDEGELALRIKDTYVSRQRKILAGIGRVVVDQPIVLLAVVLAGLIGVMAVITRGLTSSRVNMVNVLIQSSTRGIASVGQAFVILTSGIDVSIGGVGLSAAILGSVLMTTDMRLNVVNYAVLLPVGLLAMVMLGAGWGAINGLLVSRIGVPPLIVTLGMWQIATGFAFRMCGGYTIYGLPRSLAFFGQGTIAGLPVPIVIFIAVSVVAYFVLNHTTYGRSVYAVGGNPISAQLCGITVKNILFSVYIISGFLAGLAALVMTGRVVTASMASVGGLELDSIAAAVVGGVSLMGGRGSVIGVVLGAVIIGVLNNALSILGANPAIQGAAKGVVIIGAVAVDYLRRR